MEDGKTNEGDTSGKEVDKPMENSNEAIKKKPTAKEMKAENDAIEVELARTEELNRRIALGGQSEAGQQPAKEPEVSDVDYAKKAISGEFNVKK